MTIGKIRIGKAKYGKGGSISYPSYENFTTIIVISRGKKYKELSPFFLKDDKGRIMENLWQFSKVYEKVPKSKQTKSRYDSTVIWEYPKSTFVQGGEILEEYWEWREKGKNNEHAVRNPVGYKYRGTCMYSIKSKTDTTPLDYVEARKKIYVPLYCKLAMKTTIFTELKARLETGENLLLVDIDGPHEESLDYYKEKYDVDDTFIERDTMLVNNKNLKIMLNDTRHPFGHGYCLAIALRYTKK